MIRFLFLPVSSSSPPWPSRTSRIPPQLTNNTSLLPSPEVPDNVQKVAGRTPAEAATKGTTAVTAKNGQVGNLPLTTIRRLAWSDSSRPV